LRRPISPESAPSSPSFIQGFCYNFGRGIGALFPFLVGALSSTTSLGNAIAIFAVLAYGLFFLAAFALPETRGKVLFADG
jgi:ATP/ADP translocase